jgi:hypothetical protein
MLRPEAEMLQRNSERNAVSWAEIMMGSILAVRVGCEPQTPLIPPQPTDSMLPRMPSLPRMLSRIARYRWNSDSHRPQKRLLRFDRTKGR